MSKWTQFWDMHSGGGCKESPFEKIYIEAPIDEAKVIFYNRFKHNPERVTCTCCGEDYSIDESDTLEQASGFHRGCASGYVLDDGTEADEQVWRNGTLDERRELNKRFRYFERPSNESWSHNYITIEEYCRKPNVLVIRNTDIKPEERIGSVPQQGYVWM